MFLQVSASFASKLLQVTSRVDAGEQESFDLCSIDLHKLTSYPRASLLFLDAESPEKPISLYINR